VLHQNWKLGLAAGVAVALMFVGQQIPIAFAQEQVASGGPAAEVAVAPEPLSAEELEILVARIALYPDDLVSVIVSSSLYPLQIVQAQRYLNDVKTKPDLKPDSNWDGGVISLMNYPEIVKMMSDDLNWTQAMGEAITNQQQDVLNAIQQLRLKAVAEGIIKTDDKVKVVTEKETIVIQPASPDVIYVPQYEPAMLYEPNYVVAPIVYYPTPYPYYYNPTAPYFAAFVTGAVWGSVVDWDNHGIWGGNGNWGNDVNIGCNNCFNNNGFNGKVNINNVDWKNVDRKKVSFDNNQFNKVDKTSFTNSIKTNNNNSIKAKSADLQKTRVSNMPSAKSNQVKDVRNSTLEGLQRKPGSNVQKPGQGSGANVIKPGQGSGGTNVIKSGQGSGANVIKPGQGSGGTNVTKPGQNVGGGLDKQPNVNKPANIDRPVGNPKPAAMPDNRPKQPSPIGEVNRGRETQIQSNRGAQSMGGGMNRGGSSMQKRPVPPGGGGGGRGGGGRGGRR